MKEIKTIGHTEDRRNYAVEIWRQNETHFSGVILSRIGQVWTEVEHSREFLNKDFIWEVEQQSFRTWDDVEAEYEKH